MNSNFDTAELDKFASHAASWWDEEGELKTLHQINPLRLCYIKEKIDLTQLTVLDIGCGGGILTESMAKCGASVTGIDMTTKLIQVAKLHQLESQIPNIQYRCISAESLAAEQPGQFDVITCLEMLEHVPEPQSILKACATLLKPGGHLFFSTLNRNLKAYLFAILGAEYVLKLLPKGTHDYAKFIRPSELASWAKPYGLYPQDIKGISYNPLTKTFSLTQDVSVNYLIYFKLL